MGSGQSPVSHHQALGGSDRTERQGGGPEDEVGTGTLCCVNTTFSTQPVSAGIADYRPKDRETIELRLVIW